MSALDATDLGDFDTTDDFQQIGLDASSGDGDSLLDDFQQIGSSALTAAAPVLVSAGINAANQAINKVTGATAAPAPATVVYAKGTTTTSAFQTWVQSYWWLLLLLAAAIVAWYIWGR